MTNQYALRKFNASYSHLNDMQKQAVTATDGALLLLAGAGSGKTTVLINRIANLLVNKDVSPYEIIAITFTNKAAGEMKERLERMDIPGAENVWASTFHSACTRMLRRDIDKLGYERSFTIYDTSDSLALIKRIMKEQGIDEKTITPRSVLTVISRAKDEMTSPQEFADNAEESFEPDRRYIGYIYAEYEKRMKSSNSLDFDDLILMTVKLFDKHPDVLKTYQKRFKYVLVDEYQDTNNLQYRFTSALAGGYGNICVVGDDDQSIYKFRGATIRNILEFEKQYKDARVIRLEQNYRSTGAILKAANEVIKNNTGRKGKTLWTDNDNGEKPELHIVGDEQAEARFVADEIIRSVADGRKWQDHAILYRMNAQSNQFEMAFRRNDIPYKVYGGTGFYERAEVKDMLAYLCVIHNPDDDIRLLRIINNPPRGLGDTTVERLRAVAEEHGISMFAAIEFAHQYENMKSAVPKLNNFTDMIKQLQELNKPGQLDKLYDELLRRSGYVRMLRDKQSEENLSRLENIEELKTSIINFMNDSGNYDLQTEMQSGTAGGTLFDFLNEIVLYTDLDRDDHSTDKVFLMTMHSAKGLEFDTVFIVGAENGLFPGQRTEGYPDELEEERRLCYVAMTRAMRRLYFTAAEQRLIFGRTTYSRPSRFVNEAGPGNIEISGSGSMWQAQTYYTQQKTASFLPKPALRKTETGFSSEKKTGNAKSFNIGDTIRHKAFGRGKITAIDTAGGDALLKIVFDTAGEKRLLKNSASQFMEIIDN